MILWRLRPSVHQDHPDVEFKVDKIGTRPPDRSKKKNISMKNKIRDLVVQMC